MEHRCRGPVGNLEVTIFEDLQKKKQFMQLLAEGGRELEAVTKEIEEVKATSKKMALDIENGPRTIDRNVSRNQATETRYCVAANHGRFNSFAIEDE